MEVFLIFKKMSNKDIIKHVQIKENEEVKEDKNKNHGQEYIFF